MAKANIFIGQRSTVKWPSLLICTTLLLKNLKMRRYRLVRYFRPIFASPSTAFSNLSSYQETTTSILQSHCVGRGGGQIRPWSSFWQRRQWDGIAGPTWNTASPADCYGSSLPPTNWKGWRDIITRTLRLLHARIAPKESSFHSRGKERQQWPPQQKSELPWRMGAYPWKFE